MRSSTLSAPRMTSFFKDDNSRRHPWSKTEDLLRLGLPKLPRSSTLSASRMTLVRKHFASRITRARRRFVSRMAWIGRFLIDELTLLAKKIVDLLKYDNYYHD